MILRLIFYPDNTRITRGFSKIACSLIGDVCPLHYFQLNLCVLLFQQLTVSESVELEFSSLSVCHI